MKRVNIGFTDNFLLKWGFGEISRGKGGNTNPFVAKASTQDNEASNLTDHQ